MSSTIVSPTRFVMEAIPHSVREFGVEARKPGRRWESAFNGPIQSYIDQKTGETCYTVTVRLSRLKDPVSCELYSTNLVFYLTAEQMHGVHNVYDLAKSVPFTRIRGPRTPVPHCPNREGHIWYDPNPEGVIMEDVRQVPTTLPDGSAGFFVTGQGYRGKVMRPNGEFIHDVGVYGGYLNPAEHVPQLELKHLFGGIEFGAQPNGSFEDIFLTEIGDDVWVKGIVGDAVNEIHVESYKNSVRIPGQEGGKSIIGARSMSETKLLHYFESDAADALSGFRLGGFIDGLPRAIGSELWEQVKRVGLGSNFVACPEIGGHIGLIHVVLEKNNPAHPNTVDSLYPQIEEQYEGWFAWLGYKDHGAPYIKSCVRAVTPDDVPMCYAGAGELFDKKRVAFPISLYRAESKLEVGYGWGDRALFQAEFDYGMVVDRLGAHAG